MDRTDLQSQCERGQQLLMRTQYLQAERILVAAERQACAAEDYDTLARLYMPLQEVRRQIRQRCAEGTVHLSLTAQGANDQVLARHVIENYPHGQLLVAGWGSIQPALEVRRLARENDLYLETFLAAVYPLHDRRAIVVVPLEEVALPAPQPRTLEQLGALLPAHCLVLSEGQLPELSRPGTPETFAAVAALWERLHQPFLAQADAEPDPRRRIAGYRRTLCVDYACELAHQKLSDVARQLARA